MVLFYVVDHWALIEVDLKDDKAANEAQKNLRGDLPSAIYMLSFTHIANATKHAQLARSTKTLDLGLLKKTELFQTPFGGNLFAEASTVLTTMLIRVISASEKRLTRILSATQSGNT